ncbi:MAG TPA: mycofactocin-coupled SDR family oxidoreductase [Pseudolysinimonas sp.]|nr:mycofactocin-coupled SDR family oxidoreductase [Pseudolysinimonas sp.]
MDKLLEGKVAYVTGAARGQGRAHAVRLAGLGANLVLLDVVDFIPTIHYPSATSADLDETVRLVEAQGVRALKHVGDVRDQAAQDAAVADAMKEFGRLDIVVANAGIVTLARAWEVTDEQWDEVIGINLTGVWRTIRASVPAILAGGNGGSIILTSSTNGHEGGQNLGHYAASKHGVEGLMKTLANELAGDNIRVNCVAPTNVGTDMMLNPATYRVFRPDLVAPTLEEAKPAFGSYHLLDVAYVDVEDVSNAVEYLATDKSRYVTGTVMSIDCGLSVKYPAG